jgi:hypothetical protein
MLKERYLRWPAMAAEGGGFLCDYDVMNYGFPPEEAFLRSIEAGPLKLYTDTQCPCFVGGDRASFERATLLFAAWIPNDGTSARKNPTPPTRKSCGGRGGFSAAKTGWRCGGRGWEKAGLVHYSYAATQGGARPPSSRKKEPCKACGAGIAVADALKHVFP